MTDGHGRKLLVLFAGDYDSARRKGVEGLLLQYDEQGFFEKVVLVSPYLRRDRCITLDGRHELREFGLGSTPLIRRLLASLHVVRLIAACVRIVRRERIALVRATEPTLCGAIAWATARLTRFPYVVSLHADYDKLFTLDGRRGAPTLFGSRALIRPLERWTLRGAAYVMPIREALVRYALDRGVRRDRVRLIPHGIDLAALERPPALDVRRTFDVPAGKAILSFVGRLSPENYVADMLDAVARVAERRNDFVLVIAGGGVLEAEVAVRVEKEVALARVVRTVGFISQEAVLSLRAASLASICLMGGFSLIEACAAGSAVIAYDVEWHDELVTDGLTGRLVPEGDVAALAAAIEALLNDHARTSRMGAAARVRAFERHDLGRASATRRRWYDEVLQAWAR